jgi:hypothetical protein
VWTENIGFEMRSWTHNYCRNPRGSKVWGVGGRGDKIKIWCFTLDEEQREEGCLPVHDCSLTVYADINFEGEKAEFSLGEYKGIMFDRLMEHVGGVNSISSFKLSGSHCYAHLYDLPDFCGGHMEFPLDGPRACFGWHTLANTCPMTMDNMAGAHDRISSMKVIAMDHSCYATEVIVEDEMGPVQE